jgi:hypothetical protein
VLFCGPTGFSTGTTSPDDANTIGVKTDVPCSASFVYRNGGVLEEAPLTVCPGNGLCNPVLICHNNTICQDQRDLISLRRTGTFSIPTTAAAVSFSTTDIDCSSGTLVRAPFSYTIAKEGFYAVDVTSVASISGVDKRQKVVTLTLLVDGSPWFAATASTGEGPPTDSSTTATVLEISTIVPLNVGRVLTLTIQEILGEMGTANYQNSSLVIKQL